MRVLARGLALVACAAIGAAPAPSSGSPAGPDQAAQKPPLGTGAVSRVDRSHRGRRRGHGKDATPVKDLRPEDFTVRIDGGTRRIASMKFIDPSTGGTAGAPAVPGRPAVAYSSNESGAPGRLIVILVDEHSIRFGGLRAAVESIDRLLDGFGPSDRVALAALPGPRMLVDFTSDRARIAAAIKKVPGGGPGRPLYGHISVAEAFAISRGDAIVFQAVVSRGATYRLTCPTAIQMEAVRSSPTAQSDRRVQRGPAFCSRWASSDRRAEAHHPLLKASVSRGPSRCWRLVATRRCPTSSTDRLDPSLFDASITVGPVTDALEERRAAIASLDALAGAARGTTFEVTGSGENPFKRLAAEISGYYLIGVEPEASDRDGKPHQIRVEVNRPGLTVRARREFAFRPAVTDEAKMFAGAIVSPLIATELPLRVTTFNLADEDPSKVRVLVVAEIDRAQQQDGTAVVGFLLTDEKGKVVVNTNRRMTLSRADSGALSFVGAFPIPSGAYLMKFAAVYDGRVGSVEHHVAARLAPPGSAAGRPAGSALQLGDLVVMTPPVGRGALMPPVDARVRGEGVLGFVQVGLDPKVKEERTFTFDIVKEERGQALLSAPGAMDPAAKGRARVVEARFDARLLPPGDYGLRLTVSARGAPMATLFTAFSLERSVPAGRSAAPSPAAGALPGAAAARPPAVGALKDLVGARPPAAGTPPSDAVKFRPEDVLDPAVLGPFLEEVARVAPEASRTALGQAKPGRFDEALRQLKPNRADPTAPFLRGLSLFEKGQLDPAAKEFRAAIAAAPELLVGAFYIGACYAAGGDGTHAINTWQTSLIGLAQYQAVYRFLADALIRAGQWERARALLGQAAARWPDDDALRARAMRASLEAGRYDQALEYADQLIEHQPSDNALLFLAMRSIFQAVLEGMDVGRDALPRLEHYRDMYVASGGPQQALVAEWVAFVKSR
jgi:tetratricopeptide (TPR) repeat protein